MNRLIALLVGALLGIVLIWISTPIRAAELCVTPAEVKAANIVSPFKQFTPAEVAFFRKSAATKGVKIPDAIVTIWAVMAEPMTIVGFDKKGCAVGALQGSTEQFLALLGVTPKASAEGRYHHWDGEI